ncbi:MAG TPA: DUF4129 domain-containing protein [Micromonosporaceae bacterium]|nr:DUF4129 domain-containing protein [Micromonosporaceae bacterium]
MRAWNEFIAGLADLVGGIPMLAFLSLLATGVVAALWYFWPHWLPNRWPIFNREHGERQRDGQDRRGKLGSLRLRLRWRLRWRRRRRRERTPVDMPADDQLPDLPAQVLVLGADELAAAGRYAEAVRERLRAIVRELVDTDVIPLAPGWTVTELARAAILARPRLGPALTGAVDVFSEIWYGMRPATEADDAAMRSYASTVSGHLRGDAGPSHAEPSRTAGPGVPAGASR